MLDINPLIKDGAERPSATSNATHSSIQAALRAAREHLGMEIAYVSEFVDDLSVFRNVDAPGKEHVAKPGDEHSLDDIYCRHILEGRLPNLIPDTSKEPLAVSLPITQAAPIGAHMSVPIFLATGDVYGMFCCVSSKPDTSLTDRDLQVLQAFADIAAQQVDMEKERRRAKDQIKARIRETIETRAFSPVFQPIWDFAEGQVLGFECLTRFSAKPYRPPNVWFVEADEVGLGVELELAAVRAGIEASRELQKHSYITLNFSPAAVLSPEFERLFEDENVSKFVLEITEHAPLESHEELMEAIKELRVRGMKLAIDDAGAGHSGLQRIVELSPDVIKLDISLTRSLDTKPALRALASALIFFSRETGCRLIAEGIETEEELQTLKLLGVNRGQGFLLGRPVSAALAIELLDNNSALDAILKLRTS